MSARVDRAVQEAAVTSEQVAAVRPLSDSERAYQQSNEAIFGDCKREGNIAGAKAAGVTGVASVAADYVLKRTVPVYRRNIEITGKVLSYGILAYSAFYLYGFRAQTRCLEAKQILQPSRHHGVMVRGQQEVVSPPFVRPETGTDAHSSK